MWYSAPDINQSQRGWLGSKCISLGELEFTSSRYTDSAHKFIIAVSTHKRGRCESSTDQRCHLSEGAGGESDGEGGGKKTQRSVTSCMAKMEPPREVCAQTQRRK